VLISIYVEAVWSKSLLVKRSPNDLSKGLKKKQATRKRLGMHVLLIEVEERNSEGKIPSILGKERENRGRNSRPSAHPPIYL
jgi:hypothetical protein